MPGLDLSKLLTGETANPMAVHKDTNGTITIIRHFLFLRERQEKEIKQSCFFSEDRRDQNVFSELTASENVRIETCNDKYISRLNLAFQENPRNRVWLDPRDRTVSDTLHLP
uniref:Uncharacterized protein n=1 Tax=Vespula pensylvanica TaxID=30213 RepID=A0A834NKR1_VESPE|nr:hypothetical protein H0235_012893 [Vespula pensylvanica]